MNLRKLQPVIFLVLRGHIFKNLSLGRKDGDLKIDKMAIEIDGFRWFQSGGMIDRISKQN